jgi:hypothetical protein
MTDITGKIMVEAFTIFAITTKETKQGKASDLICGRRSPVHYFSRMVLRKLSGRADVQDALHLLDKGTQGEIRGGCISSKGYARHRCARRWKPGEGRQRQCGGG